MKIERLSILRLCAVCWLLILALAFVTLWPKAGVQAASLRRFEVIGDGPPSVASYPAQPKYGIGIRSAFGPYTGRGSLTPRKFVGF